MKFVSKFAKHRIVIKPARYIFNNFGERVYSPGVSARFENNIYETDDPEIIKALKANRYYGFDFTSEEKDETKSEAGAEAVRIDREAQETITTACPHCAFKATTASGLRLHIKAKHPDA